MACNECKNHNHHNTTHSYNKVKKCSPEKVCGNLIKLSTDNVIYQGREGINLDYREGDTLTSIVKMLDKAFQDISFPAEAIPTAIMTPMQDSTEQDNELATGLIVEKFKGGVIHPLKNTPKQVLTVNFCGVELDPLYYNIKGNVLYLNLSTTGVSVEPTDSIKIIYTA